MIPTIKFDVMRLAGRDDERFVATMVYQYNPRSRLDLEDLWLFILRKRPTLKGQEINVYLEGEGSPITFIPKGKVKSGEY